MDEKQIHVYIVHGVGESELLHDALAAPGDQCYGDQTNPPEEGEESNQSKYIPQKTTAKKSKAQKATNPKGTAQKASV